MQDNFSKNIMLYIALLVPVIGLALRIAPFIDEGLYAFILKFPEAMEHPFKITGARSGETPGASTENTGRNTLKITSC